MKQTIKQVDQETNHPPPPPQIMLKLACVQIKFNM